MKVCVLLSVSTLGSVHSLALIQMMTNGWGPEEKGRQTKNGMSQWSQWQKKRSLTTAVLYEERDEDRPVISLVWP